MIVGCGTGLRKTGWQPLQRERLLATPGEVLVQVGQQVEPDTIVARSTQSGVVIVVNVAHELGIDPQEVPSAMVVPEGRQLEAGNMLARSHGLFGLGRGECHAPMTCRVVSVSAVTGQVLLQEPPTALELPAFLAGKVAEIVPQRGVVIDSAGSWIQAAYGCGGESWGELRLGVARPAEVLTGDAITAACAGKIVVGGAGVELTALRAAVSHGVAALVVGGMEAQSLHEFLGSDVELGSGRPEESPLPLLLTEGFGALAMDGTTFEILRSRQGDRASVLGLTQIRAGVVRPEIIIPWAGKGLTTSEDAGLGELSPGRPVRLVHGVDFGARGVVAELPSSRRTVSGGIRTLVAVVELTDGRRLTVPRVNLEPVRGG
ncbi:MAG: hypothetical protein ABIF77_13275 [bacterium]